MLNFCDIVVAILKIETGRNFSMSGINSGHWNRTMLNLCGIVVAILKMATGRNFSMSGINSGHHYLPTYQILIISDNVEFLCRVLTAIFKMADISKILKTQNCSSNGDLSLCQILCLYIITYLEVININVRNFNFPIWFYSNPHPLWTPQNMTLTP